MTYARAALARGPLKKDREYYRFGRRMFSGYTVQLLIEAGEACRVGDMVVAQVKQ